MPKKIRLLFGLMLIITIDSYGCDCKDFSSIDSLRNVSYAYSDFVFYGELIDFDTVNFTYRFKIHEMFKGNVCDSIIEGRYYDSCSKFPRDKCNWIIYANLKENGLIDISQCLLSRSEIYPICIGCYIIPPPLSSPNADDEEPVEIEAYDKKLKAQAEKDWLIELDLLRQKKKSQAVAKYKQ